MLSDMMSSMSSSTSSSSSMSMTSQVFSKQMISKMTTSSVSQFSSFSSSSMTRPGTLLAPESVVWIELWFLISASAPTVVSFAWSGTYLGCYRSDRNLFRSAISKNIAKNSVLNCIKFCAKKKYPVVGLSQNKCTCSKRLGKVKRQRESRCAVQCKGNQSDKCGGANVVSVYSTSSTAGTGNIQHQELGKM